MSDLYTNPPRLHIIRCLTDVAKENNFVAVQIFTFLFKLTALDDTLSYLDTRSLISELRIDLERFEEHLPGTTWTDVVAYIDHAKNEAESREYVDRSDDEIRVRIAQEDRESL